MSKKLHGKEKEPSGKGRRISRRVFFKRAIVATIVAEAVVSTDIPGAIGDVVYRRGMDTRVDVPADLQEPLSVPTNEQRTLIGLGDSNSARGPLVERIAANARQRGIPVDGISAAKDGAVTDDIPGQLRQAQRRVKPKGDRTRHTDIDVFVGHNDPLKDPDAVRQIRDMQHMPLNPFVWLHYLQVRRDLRARYTASLRNNTRTVLQESGARKATLHTFSPVQNADAIDQIGPGGKSTRTVLRGNTWFDRLKRLVVADSMRQGSQAVVDVAREIKREGRVHVTVEDTATQVRPSDFTGSDQHFDTAATERIAQRTAQSYVRKK